MRHKLSLHGSARQIRLTGTFFIILGLVGVHEENQRHDEVGGIQAVTAVVLNEGLLLFIPSVLHDVFIDPIPRLCSRFSR